MPYTKDDYPSSMKNLDKDVKEKAIEILNAIINDNSMKESLAIPTAISRAKDWAKNKGKKVFNTESDKKKHGKDLYVLPKNDEWAVKYEEAEKSSFVFDTKEKAVEKAKEEAKKNNTNLIIYRKSGSIQKKHSYNR